MQTNDEVDQALRAIVAGATADDVESRTLDFTEDGRSVGDELKEVAQKALCFANSDGGTIVLGVADRRGGPEAIVGTKADPDQVARRVYELSRPALTVDVGELSFEGRRLVLVRVPRSPDIHADTHGRAPRRIGKSCVPMEPGELVRLREERRGIDWSAELAARDRADVSALALAAARERLGRLPDDRRALSRLGDDDLLRALGAVDAEGRLNRAGAVLFCDPPATASDVLVYQFRSSPGGEPRAVERLRGPTLVVFERVLELVRARADTIPVILPDGQQLVVEDFPELAVREAVANALLHRDYHLSAPVSVEHSPQVLVVTSPGPLMSGVTPSNILTHPSKPRNPTLAKAARVLRVAEEVGLGVDRMYREMMRTGRDAPTIEEGPDRVRVSLARGAPNTAITRFVAQLPENERDDTDTLLVLLHLRSKKTLDAATIAPRLQKSVDEAESVLRRLAHDEVALVEPTRQSARRAHPTYRLRSEVLQALGSAVAYTRRNVDDLDRKMVAHVQEYGSVTNRTIQNLLDVGLSRSRDLLADWVGRGLLVKTSAHERGPGVQYGPGPSFPKAMRRSGKGRTVVASAKSKPARQPDLFDSFKVEDDGPA